jgi:hypothetical protein
MWTCRQCAERLDETFEACWRCGEDRAAAQAAAPDEVEPPSELELPDDAADQVSCPFCGEDIRATARKCKHCGEWLTGNREPSEVSGQGGRGGCWLSGLGWLLLVAGTSGLIYAASLDTSVATGDGFTGSLYAPRSRVHNIGLLNDKQNALIMSGVVTLAGAVLVAAGAVRRR